MQTVTKQYRTETGHRLCNYDGKCSHLHGHSYLWEVTATCRILSDNGMVVDFKDLKRAIERVLEPLDHAMVLYAGDPLLEVVNAVEGGMEVMLRATNGKPPRLHIWPVNPTAEHFARWAAKEIDALLDDHIHVICVRVWETASSFAEWREPHA